MKKITAFALFLSLFFIACKKDAPVIEPPTTVIPTPPVNNVTASLNGQVITEDGMAVSEVMVRVGNETYLTDENGFFRVDNITMNALGTYIRFEKSGYFQASKFVEPRANMASIVQVVLLEKTLTSSFQSGDGATISTPDNATVTFSSNSIQLENGGDYSGTVNVFSKWFDPTATNLLTTMPGDLRASNQAGEFVQLATYGMLAVELESASGEPLNLVDGQTATLEFPVPTSILDNAPETIPLWYFNEATGYWIEEGSATLQGNKYVGEVGHFSFWNCDAPFPLVQLTGNLEDKFDNPISGYPVSILVNSNLSTGGGLSDENGFFQGKVPKDEILTIRIYDFCDNIIFEQEVGPFSEDVTLPTIQIEEGNLTLVYGTINDCDGNLLSNAYARIKVDDFHANANADDNGNFQLPLPTCLSGEEMTIVGYDLDSMKISDTYSFSLTEGPFLNVEEISLCEEFETFMNFTIGAETFVIPNPIGTFEGQDLLVHAAIDDDTNMYFYILNQNTPGTYEPFLMNLSAITTSYGQVSAGCSSFECEDEDITIIITTLEEVGGFIEGSFSGSLPDGATDYEVSGTFKALMQ